MSVFICYRRQDATFLARWVYDRLEARLGPGSVFLDQTAIPPGADYRPEIVEAIEAAHTVLVLIGQRWNPELLNTPNDPVRIELEEARRLDRRIVPVLAEGRTMPADYELPPDLAWFAFLHAYTVGNGDEARVAGLVEALHGFHRSNTHRFQLFVAGSDGEGSVEPFASHLGRQLANTGITVASGAGQAGIVLSMAMCERLHELDSYESSRANFHFRYLDRESPPIPERYGTVHYSGVDNKPDLIGGVLERCRAAVVIAGSKKSEREGLQAIEAGIPVVPIAASGGAAKRIWDGHELDQLGLSDPEMGADAKHLVDDHPRSTQAALRLIQAAMA